MLADDFNVLAGQARVVEWGVLCLDEVLPAVFAEILPVPGTILPILNEVFPLFKLEEVACRVLTGHRTETAGTGHVQKYSWD